jgi:uncharacterized membrane protein YesL
LVAADDGGAGNDGPARPSAPAVIGLAGAMRLAARNAYFHSWRLLPANVVWAGTAIALATAVAMAPAALILLPILALPTAGLFRVTTRIARGEAVSFWDAVDAWRKDAGATLLVGAGIAAAGAVFSINLATGLGSASPLGWGLATLAGWGLVALWLFAWTAWPIVTDPRRAAWSLRQRLRIAALLVVAHPVRIAVLGFVLAVFLVLSAVAIVALVTISAAFAALLTSQYVLPAADRLEARLAARLEAAGSGAPGDSVAAAAVGDTR